MSLALLTLHLIGLIVMAGTTMIDYYTFKTFCRLTDNGDSRSLGLLPLMSKYGALVRTGAVALILSGIAMLTISKDIWAQPLFKLKLALVIILILHGMFIGNPQATKFRDLITQNSLQHIPPIRAGLDRFYLLQLALFLIIILVSVSLPRIPEGIHTSKPGF